MAWRTSCPILTASLHSEDLMSDIEPLPASRPNSAPSTPSQVHASLFEDLSSSRSGVCSQPVSPFSHRSGSSEVTAQLYASLRQSREIEARVQEHLKSPVSGLCNFLEYNEVPACTDEESLCQGRTRPLQHMAEAKKGQNLTSSPLSSPCSQKRSISALPSFGLELCGQYSVDMFPDQPRSLADKGSDISEERRSVANQNAQGICSDYESLPDEMGHKMLIGAETEASTFRRGASRHISEMENVRSHLQGIIRASRDPPYGDLLLTTAGLGDKDEELSFASDSTATLLNARPLQELSPPLPVPSMEELFPRYASMHPRSTQDPSSYSEMQLLRDLLEKERTRRKHLERHIQNLQNRILELQQQLAIAVSADKKKDVMIEQLDKTLAKVVEGWNKHEGERNNAMRQMQEEKDVAEQARRHHQERLSKVEQSLSNTAESLKVRQLEAIERQKQIEMLEKEKKILVRSLDSEKQHGQILQSQQEEALAGKVLLQKQGEALRATLKEEQEAWAQKEQHLKESYQMIQEELKRQLENEKVRFQKETQQAQEAKQALVSTRAKVQQLELELDTVCRERDSLQMDVTLVKTRYESERMKFESELKAAMEQETTNRLAEVHEENSRQITTMREQHRKQQSELNSRHAKELTNQLSKSKAELFEREEKMRRITEEYEIRLAKFQEDVHELTDAKKKWESQRSEMVDRLQCIMQAHWNEALRVLMSESSPRTRNAHLATHDLQEKISDCKLSLDDSQNPSTQKTMTFPSKPELPSSSEPIQRKLLEFEAMESLSKAVSNMQAGDGYTKTSQIKIPTRQKPKSAVQSFHGVQMPKVPSQVAANSDDNRWEGHTVNPLTARNQKVQPASQKLPAKEFQNLIEGNSLVFPNQHNWSENPGSFFSANQNNFYPLLANGRLTADLSQLLNHSFASQMSFHPLEPQVDETGLSTACHLHSRRPDLLQELAVQEYYYPGFIRQLKAVLDYPHEEVAEHPFTDDTDENINASEGTIGEGSSFQNINSEVPEKSFVPPGDFQRQSLQQCIRMLLDRTPGDPLNEKQRSPPQSFSQISFLQGGSLEYRERSTGIWDQINQPLAEQQSAARAPQAVQKSKVSEVIPQSRSHEPCTPPKSALASQGGNLSPMNATELSHLIGLYQAHKVQPLSEELFAYLQVMEQEGLDVKSEGIQTYHGNSSARRLTDPKLNEAVKKEVVTGQVMVQRRPSITRASNEKPLSAKAVKKSAPLPSQGSMKGNRSSVWR